MSTYAQGPQAYDARIAGRVQQAPSALCCGEA